MAFNDERVHLGYQYKPVVGSGRCNRLPRPAVDDSPATAIVVINHTIVGRNTSYRPLRIPLHGFMRAAWSVSRSGMRRCMVPDFMAFVVFFLLLAGRCSDSS